MNNVVTYLLAAAEARGSLLLVDELEDGLHHSVLPDVWRALVATLRRSGGQMIVATHSDDCIAAAVTAMAKRPDEFSLIRLRATEHDVRRAESAAEQPVEAVTYEGPLVADAVKLDVEVR